VTDAVPIGMCAENNDHVFNAEVDKRCAGLVPCPFCVSPHLKRKQTLAAVCPEAAALWNYEQNYELTPEEVSADSLITVMFKCKASVDSNKPHRNFISVAEAVALGGDLDCVYCRKIYKADRRPLSQSHPHIALQWDKKKNGKYTPDDVTAGSAFLAHWKCPVAFDHTWTLAVAVRTAKNTRCPFCSGHKVSSTNSFAAKHPDLLEQWHYAKNRAVDPRAIPESYDLNVFWKCPDYNKHVWPAQALVSSGLVSRNRARVAQNQKWIDQT